MSYFPMIGISSPDIEINGIWIKRKSKEYVKNGLVLHFDGVNNTGTGHDTSATTWKDLTGNGYDGTINGPQYFQWQENNLYNTNGVVTLNVNVDSDLNLDGKERTYYFTVSDVANSEAPLLADTISGSNLGGLFMFNTFVEQRNINTNAGRITYNFYGTPVKNYAVVLKIDSLSLFVNGVLYRTTVNTEGLIGNTLRFFGGKNSAIQGSKSMKVYNMFAYDRALTAEEINQNYEIDNGRFGISKQQVLLIRNRYRAKSGEQQEDF